MGQKEKKESNPAKPVTVRIENFRQNLNKAVAESELPPFLLEMILGEMLSGISIVARQEYEKGRAEWEKECNQNG